MLDVAVSAERNVIKKEAEILKYKYPNSRNSVYVECKNKSDTINKKGNWDHFRKYRSNKRLIYRESRKSKNYRKQPYWALHTYLEK
jgi:hypothetical protein